MAVDQRIDLTDGNTRLGNEWAGVFRIGLAVGVIGMVAGVIVAWMGWFGSDDVVVRFGKSYLVSYVFVLSIALGGLFFTFVQHLTRAGWSVAVRRPAEALAANLRWMWIFFLPMLGLILSGRFGELYHWADLEHMASINDAMAAEAHLVEGKTGFLNVPFFLIRAAIYFIAWAALAAYFWRDSVRQDESGDARISDRMQRIAAPAALVFGLTITFAAFDWMMSLNPAWFSTMFGVYFFAACSTGGFAALILACLILQRAGRLNGIITAEHYQDLGKFLFAFGMVFWAYIAFSQYMLIWYANIPEETGWFLARQIGGWKWLSMGLLIGHFFVPFLLFISKHPKRSRVFLGFGAFWMLVFAWLDIYWLVMPTIPTDIYYMPTYDALAEKYAGESTQLLDPLNLLLLASFLGFLVAFTARNLRQAALLPVRDPRLHESLAFENM